MKKFKYIFQVKKDGRYFESVLIMDTDDDLKAYDQACAIEAVEFEALHLVDKLEMIEEEK